MKILDMKLKTEIYYRQQVPIDKGLNQSRKLLTPTV